MPKAPLIIQKRPSSLLYTDQAADVSVPNVFSDACIIVLEILYITDWKPAGSPMRSSDLRIGPCMRMCVNDSFNIVSARVRRKVTSSALTAWESRVAAAAPVTPM